MKHPGRCFHLLLAGGLSLLVAGRSLADRRYRSFVVDGGFEAGPRFWALSKKPAHWSREAHSGRVCVALPSPKGEWTSVRAEVRGVVPDRTYVLSFWARRDGDQVGKLHVDMMGDGWGAKLIVKPHAKEWTEYCLLVCPKIRSFKLFFQNYHSKGATYYVDDVRLTADVAAVMEQISPVKQRPAVTSNTPTFQWRAKMDPKFLSFELCYSKARSFPKSHTVVVPDLLEATEYTPVEPLSDGVWYWKLRLRYNDLQSGVTGEGESATAFFRVHSNGSDHRAPEIRTCEPMRIEDLNGAVITVKYDEHESGSGIDPSKTSLQIDGEDVTAACEISAAQLTYKVPADMTQDVHRGDVTVVDKAGNAASRRWWFLVKPKPDKGIVSFDQKRKVFLVDGEPFFPFGMYQFRHNCLGRQVDNAFVPYRSWGFNTAHFYDGEPMRGLERATEAGIKCFGVAPVNLGTESGRNFMRADIPFEDETVAPVIARRAAEMCNQPSLFCWYIKDEPDKQPMPRSRLIALRKLLNGLDPYHPTAVVLINYGAYYAYKDTADLIVGDVYPYNQWHGEDNADRIWNEPIHQDRAQGGKKPVLTVLQHFGGKKGTAWPYVIPDAHKRMMAYLAYIHGSRGIMWYAYGGSAYESRDYPERWEYMKKLAKEFETMTPVLLSDDAPEKVQLRIVSPRGQKDRAGNPAVHYTMKRHGGKLYLITVNAAKVPVKAMFGIPATISTVRELPGGRAVRAGARTFADSFEMFGTHVYEITLRR